MSDISEAEWKKALTFILEDLHTHQYSKLLGILDNIPQCHKDRSRERLPLIIIEHYGLEGSVSVIAEAMEQIPRRDPRIQNQLQPFVVKLKTKEEEKNESKRKTLDPQTEEKTATAGAVAGRSQSPMAGRPTTRKSIRDLIASNESVFTDTIGGRVVKKTRLHTSSTKKDFFYVTLRDETASLELMVYGKPHHRQIKEGKCYSFRKLLRDQAGRVKVTSDTVVSEIGIFNIPEEVEKEARQLPSKNPFYSIKDFKRLDSGTGSVKRTITELNPSKCVQVKNQEKKTEQRQPFCIEDDTDSIEVVFWGDKTQQCKKLSVGDVIVLNNVKLNRYYSKVSLQSTHTTNIEQVFKVGIRNVKIEIVAVQKAQKRQTHLDVKLDQKVHTFMVASKLLAEAFGLTLGEDFHSQLVSAVPLLAEALIDRNEIKKITPIQN